MPFIFPIPHSQHQLADKEIHEIKQKINFDEQLAAIITRRVSKRVQEIHRSAENLMREKYIREVKMHVNPKIHQLILSPDPLYGHGRTGTAGITKKKRNYTREDTIECAIRQILENIFDPAVHRSDIRKILRGCMSVLEDTVNAFD